MDERVIVNVEVVVERDGQYLLAVRSADEEYGTGWLTLPGGKLETDPPYDRALERTAQRELQEEVGLDTDLDDLHHVENHVFFIDDMPVLDVVMLARDTRGEPRALDPKEVESVVWLTAEEIGTHPEIPAWTRESVELAITYVVRRTQ